ncbi:MULTISPECIES: MurR/RpiR family transcriptional regulator [unclassified Pseudoalteromonas]|uniref:MurR/RpiR family transcriptional regulator n=1 Tax=unclassified Pseudoalteromonas TaxID=194690 RepID=UPI000B3C10A1|nr:MULTISPECIES: MurR/RpiR family transcriptional regulator [unclassified Pseudoalteromonas]MDN3379270.1 MurR/RpiR family transcriptional regulator [Pseudoalteromonas sp. APC 3893]MDN3386444.1 MurR/RpiR family transcriptional regulator [Pseudoalteromonas sp. APC 4017]OUS71298.1 RpiR family transcriptional regulator [Pseudoalteromonas sp. A601]
MSTFVKIKALRQSLSSSEAKLADFTLNSANAIRNLSSVELAKVVGVSQSSVVKFSQKLGYKGFPAFKLAVIDALNDETSEPKLHGKITLSDSLEQIAEKLLSSKLAVLSETKNLNDAPSFEQAVSLLKSAKRILICGLGGSALVAKDFSYKLQKLGMPAIAEPDGHAQLSYVSTFGKGDLVIAISESGVTREIAEVVKQAKHNNSHVISVTKFGNSPVADAANVKLYSVAEEESVRLSSILARTAQDFVIDILFIALTQSSRQGRKLLEHSNDVVGEFRNH